jgi:hypothetical protein
MLGIATVDRARREMFGDKGVHEKNSLGGYHNERPTRWTLTARS